jgi:protein-disulfide isomerase
MYARNMHAYNRVSAMSDNKEKTPISNSKKYILLGVAAVLLIGAYLVGNLIEVNKTYDTVAVANTLKPVVKTADIPHGEHLNTDTKKRFPSDQILGDASQNPSVTLIEYGSLTCPHCADFHTNVLSALKENYIDTQKIQYIFRDYPLDGAALKATLLSRCDMSKRQAFLDLLYKKQAEWTKGKTIGDIEKNLTVIGKIGGLSSEKITECLNDKKTIEEVLDVYKQSLALFNIQGTPTLIINDEKFAHGITPDTLKNIFDSLLVKQPNAETPPE